MFAETVIAAFLLGALIGAVIDHLVAAEPAWRQASIDRARLRRAHRTQTRTHLGTPYRPETTQAAIPVDVALAMIDPDAVVDNERWSRGTSAELVSLPRRRVQTGRPA